MGDKGTKTPTPDTRQKWHELVDAINNARAAYYQHDAPSISDSEYDSLFRELEALELIRNWRARVTHADGRRACIGNVRGCHTPRPPVLTGQRLR